MSLSFELIQIIVKRLDQEDLLTRDTEMEPLEVCFQLATFGLSCLRWQLEKLGLEATELKKQITNLEDAREIYNAMRPLRRRVIGDIKLSASAANQELRINKLFDWLVEALRFIQIMPRNVDMFRVAHCINEMLQRCRPLPKKRGRRWALRVLNLRKKK